jgi:hypothetical protein
MPYHNEPNTTILQPHTKYLAYYILTKKTTAHNTNHKKYLVNYNLTKNTTTHKSLQGANLTKNTTLHKPHRWERRIFFSASGRRGREDAPPTSSPTSGWRERDVAPESWASSPASKWAGSGVFSLRV